MATETPETKTLTFQDWLGTTTALYEWADSYDAKDWDRLRKICAPELLIDYTHVMGKKFERMPVDEYVAMISDPGFLGDPLLQAQHLVGMSKWEKLDDDFIVGHHQMRAAHMRFTDETRAHEEMRGHSHASNEHYYRRMPDGKWKFAGLKPSIRWNESNFRHVFRGFEVPPTPPPPPPQQASSNTDENVPEEEQQQQHQGEEGEEGEQQQQQH